MSNNNTGIVTLSGYLAEAKEIVKQHGTLEDLRIAVDNAANTYIMHQREKGKKCAKRKAVEKTLSGMGLGKFRTYLFGDITDKEARKFVLEHC